MWKAAGFLKAEVSKWNAWSALLCLLCRQSDGCSLTFNIISIIRSDMPGRAACLWFPSSLTRPMPPDCCHLKLETTWVKVPQTGCLSHFDKCCRLRPWGHGKWQDVKSEEKMLLWHSLFPGLLSKTSSAESLQLLASKFQRASTKAKCVSCQGVDLPAQHVSCLWGSGRKSGYLPSFLSEPRYRGGQISSCLFLNWMTYLSPFFCLQSASHTKVVTGR